MPTAIIIGSGPAGISAALYTARAGIDTTVISMGSGALKKAELIENYYGFSEPISGTELEKRGIEGAKRLGVKFIEDEVVSINYESSLVVVTSKASYAADGVIIATGTSRRTPPIKGIKDFEGKGVSYCAVCDAFFYRGLNVAVLGSGEYALHEASALKPVVGSVTILTNGENSNIFDGYTVNTKKLSAVCGDSKITHVEFEDGTSLEIDGLFIAVGIAGSTALARKIGAAIDGSKIVIDENMATTIPGLYAAGDCTGGMLQIAKAVYEGAKAGTELVKYLRKQ